MFDRDDAVDRVVEYLRQPVEMDPTLDTAVMARLSGVADRPRRLAAALEWVRRPRYVNATPLAGLATAAVLVGLAVLVAGRLAPARSPAVGPSAIQFVVVAPGAGSVALVGDFNDWDSTATPMHAVRSGGGALWSVTVPLSPGRYRYAFLVNGSRWLPDPGAPRAQDDFDAPSSVVTVGG